MSDLLGPFFTHLVATPADGWNSLAYRDATSQAQPSVCFDDVCIPGLFA